MSDSASWQPYQGGGTLGMMGSQGGTITWDEEYDGRLRLTLEQDESRSFHAITCFVEGWLSHARFFGEASEAFAAFDQMKPALVELSSRLPPAGSQRSPEALRVAGPLLGAFLARYS